MQRGLTMKTGRFNQSPFDDYKGFGLDLTQDDLQYLSETDPEKVDAKRLAGLVMDSRSLDSETLHFLVQAYEVELQKGGDVNSKCTLYTLIDAIKDESPEMHACLLQASTGDLDSIQVIVRACPEAIAFPFVRDAMIKVLRQYKYDEPGETKRHKEDWQRFLVPRTGGALSFNKSDMTMLVRVEKMKQHPRGDGRRGKSTASERVARRIGISEKSLKKMTRNTVRKGRPKKRK